MECLAVRCRRCGHVGLCALGEDALPNAFAMQTCPACWAGELEEIGIVYLDVKVRPA
jgi:hypothetical protein